MNLDSVVVTGTSKATSKMKSSISTSSLDGDQILTNQPQNAADVLSNIPGISVQSSGGGGNANISVRGLPISAGGSRYLQLQEDGLPVLLFGDIAFGNPDDFLRMDTTVDRVEAVRGGTGSTLTTNGPGGIVNFISKTGEEDGGAISLSSGLGYQDTRLDYNYGGHLTPKTRYFVGGYYESGQGPRIDSTSAIQGGQIKGNITHELDNGYIRLNFKALSDQQPMYMPAPVNVVNGKIQTIAGIDPRTYTGYSSNLPTDSVLNNNNTNSTINVNNGMVTRSNAIGLETHLRLADNWTLDDKFRAAGNSGQWTAFFPGSAVAAAAPGTTYANGSTQGTSYSGPALQNVVFDVNVKDLGATTNDLKLSKTFADVYGGSLSTGAGLFMNEQHVDLVWNFNGYYTTATSQPAPLNSPGLASSYGYISPGFGGCCSRDYEGLYRTTSPYAFATYEKGALSLDGSVRQDNQQASGYYNLATPISTAANSALQYLPANQVPIDYSVGHTEYSLGANYEFDKHLAVFARYSDGAAFNADRIMGNGPLSGNVNVPINVVKQFETGVKARTGNLSTFLTFFDAQVSEANYSATLQQQTANTYHSDGLELEAGYYWGNFRLSAGGTYTNSNTTASTSPQLVGQPANRQAKFIYQFGPGYSNDNIDVGLNITGTSSAPEVDELPGNAVVKMPAYTLVNAHLNYSFDEHTSVSLGVYNLFNTLAYTEVDGLTSARALNGRNARISLKYSF